MEISGIRLTALRAKITGPQQTAVGSIPSKESCLIEIHTDEGLVGIGDAQRPESPEALCYLIKDLFAPILLGKDPLQIEHLNQEMYRVQRIRGRTKGLTIEAMSAVDIALWDLLGKSLGVPVCKVLGGKLRDKLPVYATEVMYGKPRRERIKQADAFIARGFDSFKLAVGRNIREDLEIIRDLRKKYGSDVKIAVDANCALSYKSALRFSKEIERFDLLWLEEPLPPEQLESYIALRRQVEVPIAAGESEFTIFGFKDWISKGALDLVQPDVGRAGGITQVKKIASLAEAFGVDYAPHCGHGSAIIYAASAQVASTCPNFTILELEQVSNPLREKLTAKRIDLSEKGFLRVSEKPGIGIELDPDFVKRHETMTLTA
jgi:L-alanine-DL-glutamate epimerase-like enolase superfamily enzyme